MVFKGLIAGLSAAALLAAPVAATAQQTGIVSRSIAAEATPTAEQLNGQRMFQDDVEDDDDDDGLAWLWIPAGGLALVALLIWLDVLGDDNGIPVSS